MANIVLTAPVLMDIIVPDPGKACPLCGKGIVQQKELMLACEQCRSAWPLSWHVYPFGRLHVGTSFHMLDELYSIFVKTGANTCAHLEVVAGDPEGGYAYEQVPSDLPVILEGERWIFSFSWN